MSAVVPPAPGAPPVPPAPRRRRPLRTLLVVVAVVLGVLLTFLVASVALQRTETGRLAVAEPVEQVRLDLRVGRVELMAGDDDRVDVAYTRRSISSAPDLDLAVVDGVLTLGDACGGSIIAFICSVDYTVTLPADTDVVGATAAGDITIEGLSGDIDVATSAGAIDATGASGEVRLRSSAGDVTLLDSTASRIGVRTSAGDVEVTALEAPDEIDAETSAGDVTLFLPGDVGYDVLADTSAGDVTVGVIDDPAAPRVVRARTSAGDVTVLPR